MSSRKRPTTRSQLDSPKASGAPQELPHPLELHGQQPAECRMRNGTGVVVAARADSSATFVVPSGPVVERNLHVFSEGYLPFARDSGPYFSCGLCLHHVHRTKTKRGDAC